MRDRGAERGFASGALGIDMDELVVLDHIGIDVDPVLIDQMPRRHADLLTHHVLICPERDRRLLPDFIHILMSCFP